MGDEGKKMDTALLMHVFGMAKKGGMNDPIMDELLGVVREQAKINEESIKLQAAQLQPNVPFRSQNPCGEIPLTRAGWKPDGEWDCFIEMEGRGGEHIRDACQRAQKLADDESVPVRLNFNNTQCLLYPQGKWEEGCSAWNETRAHQDRQRAKKANFSKPYSPQDTQVAVSMMRDGVFAVDTETTGLTMQVLKSRKSDEGEPGHFFKGLREFLGDD